MSGVTQATFMNQRSFGLTIGSAYEGGFFAGQIGTSGVASHNLVVAPLSSGQASMMMWKNENTAAFGADSDINGPQNTADIVANGNATVYPAAHFCNNVSIGGFSDWYMPAFNELEVCYFNLKPGTLANSLNTFPISSGINPNAVPARASPYTAIYPVQTRASAFKTGGAEPFVADASSYNFYWSSTDQGTYGGKAQYFRNGLQTYGLKTNPWLVRAVRRVAV